MFDGQSDGGLTAGRPLHGAQGNQYVESNSQERGTGVGGGLFSAVMKASSVGGNGVTQGSGRNAGAIGGNSLKRGASCVVTSSDYGNSAVAKKFVFTSSNMTNSGKSCSRIANDENSYNGRNYEGMSGATASTSSGTGVACNKPSSAFSGMISSLSGHH